MSLDVYLTVREPVFTVSEETILVRSNGGSEEISRAEWNRRNPGVEPVVVPMLDDDDGPQTVYSANITHNLNKMAMEADIYQQLWRPEEVGIKTAKELISPLSVGLALLKSRPEMFKNFNPKNGWGTYEGLVKFVENYLAACQEFPEASVNVSR